MVIGGSAGSLHIILDLVRGLSPLKSISIFLVIHRKPNERSRLEELLKTKNNGVVRSVEHQDEILRGKIYTAPPNYHLLAENEGVLSLDYGEKVLFSRPSIDVTFSSFSFVFKERLHAFLLSGANRDGADGMLEVKRYGGKNYVQDPSTASSDAMPSAAIKSLEGDLVIFRPDEILNLIHSIDNHIS